MLLVLKRSKCSLKETKLKLWLLKMTCKCVNGRMCNCHFLEVALKGNWECVRWQLASPLLNPHWALEPDTSNFSIISRLLSSSQVQPPPWGHLMCQVQWCLVLLLRLFPSRKSPPLSFPSQTSSWGPPMKSPTMNAGSDLFFLRSSLAIIVKTTTWFNTKL